MTLLQEIQAAQGFLDEMRRQLDAGRAPDLGDAGLLEHTAKAIRELCWHAHIEAIRERSAEQDLAAQIDMAAGHHARADRIESERPTSELRDQRGAA